MPRKIRGVFWSSKLPTKAYINLNYVLYIIIKCGLPEPNIVPKGIKIQARFPECKKTVAKCENSISNIKKCSVTYNFDQFCIYFAQTLPHKFTNFTDFTVWLLCQIPFIFFPKAALFPSQSKSRERERSLASPLSPLSPLPLAEPFPCSIDSSRRNPAARAALKGWNSIALD